MSGYTIERQFLGMARDVNRTYVVLNPSGVPIAYGMSWRVARKIADALEEQYTHETAIERLALEMRVISARRGVE